MLSFLKMTTTSDNMQCRQVAYKDSLCKQQDISHTVYGKHLGDKKTLSYRYHHCEHLPLRLLPVSLVIAVSFSCYAFLLLCLYHYFLFYSPPKRITSNPTLLEPASKTPTDFKARRYRLPSSLSYEDTL